MIRFGLENDDMKEKWVSLMTIDQHRRSLTLGISRNMIHNGTVELSFYFEAIQSVCFPSRMTIDNCKVLFTTRTVLDPMKQGKE